MPRRGQISKRDVLPDPVYNSKLVTRLINSIMLDGKKGVAQKIVYDAFDIVGEKTGENPLKVFEQAMENPAAVCAVAPAMAALIPFRALECLGLAVEFSGVGEADIN